VYNIVAAAETVITANKPQHKQPCQKVSVLLYLHNFSTVIVQDIFNVSPFQRFFVWFVTLTANRDLFLAIFEK